MAELNARLRIRTGEFVEFGAWDGKHLSNTYRLLEKGWRGVYIEGDRERFEALRKNMAPFSDRVTVVNAFVSVTGENCLDRLLSDTSIRQDFDVLSIDIDSHDWQVWESLRNYWPKIVIIEINSHIPVGVYQVHDGVHAVGSSFSSMVSLGHRKGYTPVCHTGNLIFVRNDLVGKIGLPEHERRYPELLFDYSWVRLNYAEPVPESLSARLYRKCVRSARRMIARLR